MPRYLVERDFAAGLHIPMTPAGVSAVREIIARNTACDVIWVHSFVSDDKRKSFCIYDAPNPEAIRRAAHRNDLPVGRITRVSALDPYFYLDTN